MRVVEKEAKTEEEAVQAALAELGLSRDEVEVEVLSQRHRGGILGFMGQPVVTVRVSEAALEPDAEQAPADTVAPADEVTPEGAEAEPAQEQSDAEPVGELTDDAPPDDKAAPPVDEDEPADSGEDEQEQEADSEEEKDPAEVDSALDPDEAAPEDEAQTDDGEDYDDDEEFEWSEEARLLVQDILDRMGLDLTAETQQADEEGSIRIECSGPDLGILIGRQGTTINAFQYLINVILNRQSSDYLRIVIDGEGYRDRRERSLQRMARQAAERARRSGVEVRMEPLRAFERRLVHLALQDDRSVSTFSEGEDPYRRVVVAPSEESASRDDDLADPDSGERSERRAKAEGEATPRHGIGRVDDDDFERRWLEEDEDEEYEFIDEDAEEEDSADEASSDLDETEESPFEDAALEEGDAAVERDDTSERPAELPRDDERPSPRE